MANRGNVSGDTLATATNAQIDNARQVLDRRGVQKNAGDRLILAVEFWVDNYDTAIARTRAEMVMRIINQLRIEGTIENGGDSQADRAREFLGSEEGKQWLARYTAPPVTSAGVGADVSDVPVVERVPPRATVGIANTVSPISPISPISTSPVTLQPHANEMTATIPGRPSESGAQDRPFRTKMPDSYGTFSQDTATDGQAWHAAHPVLFFALIIVFVVVVVLFLILAVLGAKDWIEGR